MVTVILITTTILILTNCQRADCQQRRRHKPNSDSAAFFPNPLPIFS